MASALTGVAECGRLLAIKDADRQREHRVLRGAMLPKCFLDGVGVMQAAAKAGFLSFGLVFAAGFVLGALRILVLAPRLGEGWAVLVELPIILAISWVVCRFAAAHYGVPPTLAARLAMGATAFGLLLAAEAGLGVLAFGRSIAEHAAAYATPAGALGLGGQVLFGVIPIVQSRLGS